jgi:hypothetical protein
LLALGGYFRRPLDLRGIGPEESKETPIPGIVIERGLFQAGEERFRVREHGQFPALEYALGTGYYEKRRRPTFQAKSVLRLVTFCPPKLEGYGAQTFLRP